MNSFSLRDDGIEQPSVVLQSSTIGKRKLKCCFSIGALFVVSSTCFVIGYEYRTRMTSSLNAAPRCSDLGIDTELAAGLEKMAEWYPEGAAEIRSNERDIIHYMTSMTNPPRDSSLRTLALTSAGRRLSNQSKSDQMQRSQKEANEPDVDDDEEAASELDADYDDAKIILRPDNCSAAVAILLYDIVDFVTNFVLITIPKKYRFRVRLLKWLHKSYEERRLDWLADLISQLAHAPSAKDKAKIVFLILFQAWLTGGGWLKFVFDWVMDESRNTWEGLKRCARLAAQLSTWFSKGIVHFIGQASLWMMSIPKMIASAKNAKKICDKSKNSSIMM